MNKYDPDQFEAMFMAGYSPAEALSEVHAFYERETARLTKDASVDAYQRGRDNGKYVSDWWAGVAGIVCVSLICFICWYLFTIPSRIDDATLSSYLDACKNGDTVGCLEAVQDQSRMDNLQDNKHQNEFADRVKRYRLAYRLKTGHDLPEN